MTQPCCRPPPAAWTAWNWSRPATASGCGRTPPPRPGWRDGRTFPPAIINGGSTRATRRGQHEYRTWKFRVTPRAYVSLEGLDIVAGHADLAAGAVENPDPNDPAVSLPADQPTTD